MKNLTQLLLKAEAENKKLKETIKETHQAINGKEKSKIKKYKMPPNFSAQYEHKLLKDSVNTILHKRQGSVPEMTKKQY